MERRQWGRVMAGGSSAASRVASAARAQVRCGVWRWRGNGRAGGLVEWSLGKGGGG